MTIPDIRNRFKIEDCHASGGMVMKRLMFILVAAAGLAVAAVPQEDGEYRRGGSVKDFDNLFPQTQQKNEFTFVRLIYNGRIQSWLYPNVKNWYTDYPKGDAQLVRVYQRLLRTDVAPESRALPILHPDLPNYPFVYSSEAGQMILTPEEAKRMREYVEHGGFWMIDDFWGSYEWKGFEEEIGKVFPDEKIVDIPLDHPIFHSLFNIDRLVQVPHGGWPDRYDNPATFEQDGDIPYARGIFDKNGRLAVFINWNTDLMDGSEMSDNPRFPEHFSTHSYKIFMNAHAYALTH